MFPGVCVSQVQASRGFLFQRMETQVRRHRPEADALPLSSAPGYLVTTRHLPRRRPAAAFAQQPLGQPLKHVGPHALLLRFCEQGKCCFLLGKSKPVGGAAAPNWRGARPGLLSPSRAWETEPPARRGRGGSPGATPESPVPNDPRLCGALLSKVRVGTAGRRPKWCFLARACRAPGPGLHPRGRSSPLPRVSPRWRRLRTALATLGLAGALGDRSRKPLQVTLGHPAAVIGGEALRELSGQREPKVNTAAPGLPGVRLPEGGARSNQQVGRRPDRLPPTKPRKGRSLRGSGSIQRCLGTPRSAT